MHHLGAHEELGRYGVVVRTARVVLVARRGGGRHRREHVRVVLVAGKLEQVASAEAFANVAHEHNVMRHVGRVREDERLASHAALGGAQHGRGQIVHDEHGPRVQHVSEHWLEHDDNERRLVATVRDHLIDGGARGRDELAHVGAHLAVLLAHNGVYQQHRRLEVLVAEHAAYAHEELVVEMLAEKHLKEYVECVLEVVVADDDHDATATATTTAAAHIFSICICVDIAVVVVVVVVVVIVDSYC